MKCMEYSNQNHINIIPQKEFEDLIKEVFSVIATNLSRSLGPLGSSATIFNGSLVEATKDGYYILKSYSFNNRYKKMIYNLIKTPCTKMNNTVGDGTTTAIALTNAIFNRYEDRKSELYKYYRLPRVLIKIWDNVVEEIIKRVNNKAKPLDPENYESIYNIAYVVSNGNSEVSKAVAETYAVVKCPNIKMKDSPTNKSYISQINGFEFPTNAIDTCYVRNQDLTSTEQDVATLIFDHTIETDVFNKLIQPINEVMRAMGKKLIVIASAYDNYMCETVLGQYVNYEANRYKAINLILTQYQSGKLKEHQLNDLAVILRSKPITQSLEKTIITMIENGNVDKVVDDILNNDQSQVRRCIGSASTAMISCKNGCIFDVKDIADDESYQEAMRSAQAELEDILAHIDYEKQSYAAKTYEARARIMQLEMKNFIYYVGADSDLQKQILQGAIEDVIKCLRSATKSGVVPGCQISIIQSCDELLNELGNSDDAGVNIIRIILEIIRGACIDVYKMILNGPDNDGIMKLLPRWQYMADTEEAKEAMSKDIEQAGNNLIDASIAAGKVFDLETADLNEKIITSAETDTMVLSVASELIKILITGNQCIFLDSDVTESHQDEMEVYV